MKGHPGDFCNKVGDDLYLNPWWGLDFVDDHFCEIMTEVFGTPDLWFQGGFHEILWGPREIPRIWRPSFHVNLSGPQGLLYFHLWLPWRGDWTHPAGPIGSNILIDQINIQRDLSGLCWYVEKFNISTENSNLKSLKTLFKLV